MTAGDFIPGDEFEPAPEYPVIFGIQLTPLVMGIGLSVVGIGGAIYLWLNFVQPELDKFNTLSAAVADKQAQVEQQRAATKKIEDAQKDLAAAEAQQKDVLKLFADESTLDTLLLDLNRQIDARNAGLASERAQRLAKCSDRIKRNISQFEKQAGDLATRAELKKFNPDAKVSGIIADGSYGSLVDNKLKRQVVAVELRGNFDQTLATLRNIERLQPLLVFRNVEAKLSDKGGLLDYEGGQWKLSSCQPDTVITTTFNLEALLPLNDEDRAKLAPAAPPPPAQ